MSYDPTTQNTAYATTRVVDAGLQAYMRGIYNTMSLGLVVTGLTAFGVANIPVVFNLIFGTPLAWVAMLALLAFLWMGFTPARIERMSADKLRVTFMIFSAVMGISMAAIFQVFTAASIARVFFITAGTFAATSLYGYTTKRDLTGLGSFLFMGVVVILIASLANLFIQSSAVHFAVSVIGVIAFTGLAAWDTQRLKESYAYGHGSAEANAKITVVGALSLYMNFVNLFNMLLNLMGDRR